MTLLLSYAASTPNAGAVPLAALSESDDYTRLDRGVYCYTTSSGRILAESDCTWIWTTTYVARRPTVLPFSEMKAWYETLFECGCRHARLPTDVEWELLSADALRLRINVPFFGAVVLQQRAGMSRHTDCESLESGRSMDFPRCPFDGRPSEAWGLFDVWGGHLDAATVVFDGRGYVAGFGGDRSSADVTLPINVGLILTVDNDHDVNVAFRWVAPDPCQCAL